MNIPEAGQIRLHFYPYEELFFADFTDYAGNTLMNGDKFYHIYFQHLDYEVDENNTHIFSGSLIPTTPFMDDVVAVRYSLWMNEEWSEVYYSMAYNYYMTSDVDYDFTEHDYTAGGITYERKWDLYCNEDPWDMYEWQTLWVNDDVPDYNNIWAEEGNFWAFTDSPVFDWW